MRLTSFAIAAGALFFFACNSQQNKTENKDSTAAARDTVPITKCYEYFKGKDSVTLKAVYLGNAVSGMLTYKLDGKDRNTGTFSGDMKGDKLVAYYTFFSEGMQSVRQVVFKKEGANLLEGYGNVYSNKDSVLFRSIDSLQFTNTIKLAETPCK